jgi:hypothetical protein
MEDYNLDKNSPYFTIKYFPDKISDLATNDIKIKQFSNWLDSFKNNALANRNICKKKNRVKISKKKINIDGDGDDGDGNVNVNLDVDIDVNIDAEVDYIGADIGADIDLNINDKSKNNNIEKSCAIITGTHGIGKSAFVFTILKEKKYDIKVINFEKINQKKNINEFIEKTMRGVSIYDSVMDKKNNFNKAIVIDNVEIVSSPNEKFFITTVLKQNELEWNFPIIFICNNKHNKLINFIKKSSYEIELFSPTIESLINIMAKICLNEKIIFTDENLYRQFIEHSKKDMRLLITNLQTVKQIFGNKVFGQEQFLEFIKISKVKDQDLDIFESGRKLIYSYDNIDEIIRIFETEKTIIPLMIQHHYISFLGDKNISTIKEISNSLSKGDVVENYIYDHNMYDIRDTQAFHQCVKPSFLLSKKLNPNKIPNDKIKTKKMSFPLDLNKTSIKFINYTKNIIPSNDYFKNMKLDDYIYLNKILKGLLEIDNYSKINEYIKGYNIDINGIESVLKINKLNGEKFTISTKNKKNLIKNCDNISDINLKQIYKNKKIKSKKNKKI